MKLFLAAFLAVASAQPQWLHPTVYNTPVVGAPMVHQYPIASTYGFPSFVKPVTYVKPVSYFKDDKIQVAAGDAQELKVEKTEEVKPIVYNSFTPFGVHPVATPVEYKVDVPAKYHSKSAGGVENVLHKREAEPVFPYAHSVFPYSAYTHSAVYPYSHYMPYTTVAKPIVPVVPKVTYKKPVVESDAKVVANDAINHFGYAAKGQYVADSEGALHIAKRDAESQFLTYGAHIATPYTHYNTPYMTHYNAPVAHAYGMYPALYNVKSYSNDFVKPEEYASKGQYHAETAGSVHIAKREADPLVYKHPISGSTYAVGSAYQTPFVHSSYGSYIQPYYNTFNRPLYYY